jgi:hypothetical protein
MGTEVNGGEMTFQLCDKIWEKLNKVMCTPHANQQTKKETISISPNPAQQVVQINGWSATQNLKISIRNIYGKLLHEYNNRNTLDISELTPGLYIVEFMHSNSKIIQKLLKQ